MKARNTPVTHLNIRQVAKATEKDINSQNMKIRYIPAIYMTPSKEKLENFESLKYNTNSTQIFLCKETHNL